MQDPLLNSLIYISRYFGLANSPEALINGLPLSSGKLTPFLFPRSAERAGLVAKENRSQLTEISELVLPVVLLLKGGDACVLNTINLEKQEAEVVTGESGLVPISISIEELNELYIGRYFLVKKQIRYDERSPEILKTRQSLVLVNIVAVKEYISRRFYRFDNDQFVCNSSPYVYTFGLRQGCPQFSL